MIPLADKILVFYRVLEELLTFQKNTAFGLDKSRASRKLEVHRLSEFFIQKSWSLMESELNSAPWFGIESRKTFDELFLYLSEIETRSSAFPWAWIRARATEAIFARLESLIPRLSDEFPKEMELYRKALHKAGIYWFRQSPKQHLEAGYHTALAAVWKVLGEENFQIRRHRGWSDEDSVRIKKALRGFATFHMEYLLASDGALWDSAGATPYGWGDDLKEVHIVAEAVRSKFNGESLGVGEARLGCPALRAKHGAQTVFDGVWDWSLKIFKELYLPAFCGVLTEPKEAPLP